MKFLIVKNISREGPGLLENVLREKEVSFDVADLAAGEAFPELRGYDALVVMGGPQSANDETPAMRLEVGRVRECLRIGMPYLGICLGMQVLVKAAGGRVVRSPVKEVGFRDPTGGFFEVVLTGEGRRVPLFDGVGETFRIFQLHGETVEFKDEARLLGTGRWCRNQVVKAGESAYGLQGHVELTPELLELWQREDPDLSGLDREELVRDFGALRIDYEHTGRRILGNFVEMIRRAGKNARTKSGIPISLMKEKK